MAEMFYLTRRQESLIFKSFRWRGAILEAAVWTYLCLSHKDAEVTKCSWWHGFRQYDFASCLPFEALLHPVGFVTATVISVKMILMGCCVDIFLRWSLKAGAELSYLIQC